MKILTFILYTVHLLFVHVCAGSDWEVCKTGCLSAPVHCTREVGSNISVNNLYSSVYNWMNVIKVVFICLCLLSFQLWKHSTTFWTSIFVRKTQHDNCCAVRQDFVLMKFLCCPTGGMTRKPRCTMFCSACRRFHSQSSTYCAKEQTQTGLCNCRCTCEFLCVCL